MTTHDVLRRPDGTRRPLSPPARPAHAARFTPAPASAPAHDPDATVVIGRHRQGEGPTVVNRSAAARPRFLGRVAAATVGLLRRRPAETGR